VIIGDGHDNSSKKTLDEALEIAQRQLSWLWTMKLLCGKRFQRCYGREDFLSLRRATDLPRWI
jgi:hypothetical protein